MSLITNFTPFSIKNYLGSIQTKHIFVQSVSSKDNLHMQESLICKICRLLLNFLFSPVKLINNFFSKEKTLELPLPTENSNFEKTSFSPTIFHQILRAHPQIAATITAVAFLGFYVYTHKTPSVVPEAPSNLPFILGTGALLAMTAIGGLYYRNQSLITETFPPSKLEEPLSYPNSWNILAILPLCNAHGISQNNQNRLTTFINAVPDLPSLIHAIFQKTRYSSECFLEPEAYEKITISFLKNLQQHPDTELDDMLYLAIASFDETASTQAHILDTENNPFYSLSRQTFYNELAKQSLEKHLDQLVVDMEDLLKASDVPLKKHQQFKNYAKDCILKYNLSIFTALQVKENLTDSHLFETNRSFMKKSSSEQYTSLKAIIIPIFNLCKKHYAR